MPYNSKYIAEVRPFLKNLISTVTPIIENEMSPYFEKLEILKKKGTAVSKTPKWINIQPHKLAKFKAHEIVVIDSPIFQRLRFISQTSFAKYTYPAASHTRFEHSLSVANFAGEMHRSLTQTYKNTEDVLHVKDDSECRASLRMSGLLHDIGHGIFSHSSEDVYKDDLRSEISKVSKLLEIHAPKPHEMLSFAIVLSEPMGKLLNYINDMYHKNFQQDTVAFPIIGFYPNKKERYLADIINGDIDADKLDYLIRDGFTSGISTSVDPSVLLRYLRISIVDEERVLAIDTRALSVIEQIMMSKLMLFDSLYHHHKVRSSHASFRRILEQMSLDAEGAKLENPLTHNGFDFTFYKDFLATDETDFFGVRSDDVSKPAKAIREFKNRNYLKRALVLNNMTAENGSEESKAGRYVMARLTELFGTSYSSEKAEKIDNLRKQVLYRTREILKERNSEQTINYSDIQFDFPSNPSVSNETPLVYRIGETQNSEDQSYADELDRLRQPTVKFRDNRLRAYLFGPDNEEVLQALSEAAREILSDKQYGIICNDNAHTFAKLSPPPSR